MTMWLTDKIVTLMWFFFGFKVLNYLDYRLRSALKRILLQSPFIGFS